jgi:hypothetical protein
MSLMGVESDIDHRWEWQEHTGEAASVLSVVFSRAATAAHRTARLAAAPPRVWRRRRGYGIIRGLTFELWRVGGWGST